MSNKLTSEQRTQYEGLMRSRNDIIEALHAIDKRLATAAAMIENQNEIKPGYLAEYKQVLADIENAKANLSTYADFNQVEADLQRRYRVDLYPVDSD